MRYFKFTIFTPLYNGEKTVHRVFNSLRSSTYKNFEWIVVNDGSLDNTEEVFTSIIKNVDWDITFINRKENKGKHIAWNEAARIAKGDLFIVVDCDDGFKPESLSFFNEKWNEYYDDKEVSGIEVLCEDAENGNICGIKYPYDGIKSNYRDFYSILKVRGDKWHCFRTEYIKLFPYPEIKANYYTECYLHYSLSEKYIQIGYNKSLHIYYKENNSITHTKKENRNNLYMICHYQKWHIPRIATYLLKRNPRELCRCIKELIVTTIKYYLMRLFKIEEVKYYKE